MKTNLEKWNYYLSIINERSNKFIQLQLEDKNIPEKYYIIKYNHEILEKSIMSVEYSHYKHGLDVYNKKPSKKDIAKIMEYSSKEIPFSNENIYFKTSDGFSYSHISLLDILNSKGLYLSKQEAEKESTKLIEKINFEKQFKQEHQKDINYNYAANGYKFLGWQNSWKYEYYDEDGNLCTETGNPRKSLAYPKEVYPEYRNCIDSKHLKIEVSHSNRGVENTVSCPICKIYWKYDCSG